MVRATAPLAPWIHHCPRFNVNVGNVRILKIDIKLCRANMLNLTYIPFTILIMVNFERILSLEWTEPGTIIAKKFTIVVISLVIFRDFNLATLLAGAFSRCFQCCGVMFPSMATDVCLSSRLSHFYRFNISV